LARLRVSGKTYEMLSAAKAKSREGFDVVVGVC